MIWRIWGSSRAKWTFWNADRYHAVSPEKRDPNYWESNAPLKLLFVGRISKDKNVDVLVELYQQLAPKYPDFVLHVVGDGPYFHELQKKTSSLPRFIMTGAKFKEDLAQAYASSDLFVYPGLLDTFGNVIIEAQASGLPCVVMNEGGPQELILANETGMIANSNRHFIQLVEELINDPERRQRMSAKAAEFAAERFAEERIFTHFWNVITAPLEYEKPKHEFRFETRQEQAERKVISLTG